MWWRDKWCRKRLEWWQRLFFYRCCDCSQGICYPMGETGPKESR